jgi:transcriptional regulator with PAS, ATPase and Fis domain
MKEKSESLESLVQHLLSGNIYLGQAIEILERSMIRGALSGAAGNQCAAAKQLGIHRNTLLAKIRKYELENGRKPVRKPMARAAGTRKRKKRVA